MVSQLAGVYILLLLDISMSGLSYTFIYLNGYGLKNLFNDDILSL